MWEAARARFPTIDLWRRKAAALGRIIGSAERLLILPAQQPIHGHLEDIRKSVEFNVGDGTLLSLQQRKRGRAHVNAGSLQLGQQLVLLHVLGEAGLGNTRPDDVAISAR